MKIKEYLRNEGGFTLVELLVVIVIIGVLAVGVLAAINPIEQIRRGRDTARQSAAREFMSACERYYGVREEYPWDTAGVASEPSGEQLTDVNWPDYGEYLVTEKELRAGFENRSAVANGELFITEDGDENVHVCFLPESDAFDDKADCSNETPVGDGSVCDGSVAGDEYFCVPDSTN